MQPWELRQVSDTEGVTGGYVDLSRVLLRRSDMTRLSRGGSTGTPPEGFFRPRSYKRSMSINQFRERVAGMDVSPETADAYTRWVKVFQAWNDGSAITEGLLRDFSTDLEDPDRIPLTDRDEGYAHSTRLQAISAVKKWAEVMHDVEIRPDADDLVRGDPEQFDPTVLSRDEASMILQDDCALEGCKAARAAGYDLIMRAAEIADMRPDDVDELDRTVYVRAVKNSENRTLGVSDRTIDLLRDQEERVDSWFSRPQYLFYNSYRNRLTADALRKHFAREHHEAGIHAFARHTSIVHHIQDEGFGQTYLRARHSNPSMTARYASIAGVEAPSWSGV